MLYYHVINYLLQELRLFDLINKILRELFSIILYNVISFTFFFLISQTGAFSQTKQA